MSVSTAISRREFLARSGLVIGVSIVGIGSKVAAKTHGAGEAIQQNAFLAIDTEGKITFFSPYSEMGQGVYTAIPTLLAEELEVPVESIHVEIAKADPVYTNQLLGTQATGGSTAVRDSYTRLRLAGAEARARLLQAAANEWGRDTADLTMRDGAVRAPGGQKLGYGELASAAAELDPPGDIAVKSPDQFTQIGKPRRRLDTPPKTDGTAEFGIDVRRPNQAYAAIAMSPSLRGKVVGVDAKAARESAGVIDVIETPEAVIVVAEAWWDAKSARDKLDVQWDDSATRGIDDASIFRDLKQAAEQNMKNARVARQVGDAPKALDDLEQRLDATYELPVLAHATMEPMNCTAEFEDDELHIYVGTQVQLAAQQVAAEAAGLPTEKVHVHTTFLGGGFGRRLEVDFIPPAVVAAKKVGRPVQLIWTREDDMTHDIYRPPAVKRLSAGFNDKGKLQAWQFDIISPSPTARWAPAVVADALDPFVIEAAANYPYAVPNVLVRHLQHEVGFHIGYWRSVSHATNCFAGECFMDELAHAAEADPYEFRRGLLEGKPLWRSVLDLAAEKANWGKAPEGRHQGIALMEGYNTYMAQVAEISVRDGKLKVHRITCATDCGQIIDPGTVEAQTQSSIIFGLSAALWGEINMQGGRVQQQNFDTMRVLRMNEIPELNLHVIESSRDPGGMGEPATALVAPAVANAIFAATGKRIRRLPFSRAELA